MKERVIARCYNGQANLQIAIGSTGRSVFLVDPRGRGERSHVGFPIEHVFRYKPEINLEHVEWDKLERWEPAQ